MLAQCSISRARHSRESENPSAFLPQSKMDSRFRGNDVKQKWGAALNSSHLPSKSA